MLLSIKFVIVLLKMFTIYIEYIYINNIVEYFSVGMIINNIHLYIYNTNFLINVIIN